MLWTTKAWGTRWTKNSTKEGGAQAARIENLQLGEIPVNSHTNKYGLMWGNMQPDTLFRLLEGNRGLFEILLCDARRKVYFDIDGDGEYDRLEAVKGAIASKFPNARMAISGSKTAKKTSYHIVLTNYFFDNHRGVAQKALARWVGTLPADLTVDKCVYARNQHFTCIRQSKPDGRIQQRIEGPEALTKHLVLHDFDDDAMDASGLDW